MPKLKPCPFCGGPATFDETEAGGRYVRCTSCDAASVLMFPEKCSADPLLSERWNKRSQYSDPPEDEALDAELRRWQDAIRRVVIKESGASDCDIDGGGCDSGDPLDLTLTEIQQGFRHIKEGR